VWEWVFAVNFWGVQYGCSAFLPIMRRQREGHVVNVASHAALTGYFPAGTPYVASKFAVLGLSRCGERATSSHLDARQCI